MQISFKKIMLIYKINLSLLFFPYLFIFFVGVALRGVPDADRQKYKQRDRQTDRRSLGPTPRIGEQTDDLCLLRQRTGEQNYAKL